MSADNEILTKWTEAINQLTNNTLPTSGIQAVSLELPEYWIDDPRFGSFERKHNLELNL